MHSTFLHELSKAAAELLAIPVRGRGCPRIDLSIHNPALHDQMPDRTHFHNFVENKIQASGCGLVWGGYLEHRAVYAGDLFAADVNPRCIHLGLDFWAAAGTAVFAPLSGIVHSFHDNAGFCNYGPTIILKHAVRDQVFYSLYGHLARASLVRLQVGTPVEKGSHIGWLGAFEENGNWPPHLHFQLIRDLGEWVGDYPGVCAEKDVPYYRENCPDPAVLLGL